MLEFTIHADFHTIRRDDREQDAEERPASLEVGVPLLSELELAKKAELAILEGHLRNLAFAAGARPLADKGAAVPWGDRELGGDVTVSDSILQIPLTDRILIGAERRACDRARDRDQKNGVGFRRTEGA